MTGPSGEATVASALLLRIVSSDLSDRSGQEIPVSDVMIIGRETGCDIVLPERDVSRKHAKIESTSDGLLLTDLGSSTGVWIGSTEVKSQLLRPGDRVRLGEHVTIECVLVGAAAEAAKPVAAAAPVAEPPVAAQPVEDPFSTRFISAADVPKTAPPPAAPAVDDSN